MKIHTTTSQAIRKIIKAAHHYHPHRAVLHRQVRSQLYWNPSIQLPILQIETRMGGSKYRQLREQALILRNRRLPVVWDCWKAGNICPSWLIRVCFGIYHVSVSRMARLARDNSDTRAHGDFILTILFAAHSTYYYATLPLLLRAFAVSPVMVLRHPPTTRRTPKSGNLLIHAENRKYRHITHDVHGTPITVLHHAAYCALVHAAMLNSHQARVRLRVTSRLWTSEEKLGHRIDAFHNCNSGISPVFTLIFAAYTTSLLEFRSDTTCT